MSLTELETLRTTDGHELCPGCSDPITPDDPHDDCAEEVDPCPR